MKTLKLFVCAFGAVLSTQAALITYEAGTATATTTFTPATLTLSPDIPLFDPDLGTLTQVELYYEGEIEGDFAFTNLGNSSGTVGGFASSSFVLYGPGGLGALLSLSPQIAFAGTVNAGQKLEFNNVSGQDNDTFTSSAALVLAAFTGAPGGTPGNLGISAEATQTGSPVLNFSPGLFEQSVSGNALVRVRYTYEDGEGPPGEIPEPSTWAMMGSGLALAGIARLRARSR